MVQRSGPKSAKALLLARQAGFASSFLNPCTGPIQTPARRHHYGQMTALTVLRTHERKAFLPSLLQEFCHSDRFSGSLSNLSLEKMVTIGSPPEFFVNGNKHYTSLFKI